MLASFGPPTEFRSFQLPEKVSCTDCANTSLANRRRYIVAKSSFVDCCSPFIGHGGAGAGTISRKLVPESLVEKLEERRPLLQERLLL